MRLANGDLAEWLASGCEEEGFLSISRKRWFGLWYDEFLLYRSPSGLWNHITNYEYFPVWYLNTIVSSCEAYAKNG